MAMRKSNVSADVRQRNLKLLRFLVLPLCFAVIAGCFICYYTVWSPAVPTSVGPDTRETALTNFSDDLGVASELRFTTIEKDREALSRGSLVLVNGNTRWEADKTDTMVPVYDNSIPSYQLSGSELQLQEEVIGPFNEMMENFVRITGFQDVMISECYRSKEAQTKAYKQAAGIYGSEETKKMVARPGYSEHHTGYAVALSLYTKGTVMDFLGTDDCAWLLRNCTRYGFVLRYPEGKEEITGYYYQPWHLRYVGRPHAYLMNLKQYCLEEYLEYVSHYTFGGNHIQVTDNLNQKYEIYYVPAQETVTNVPVPMDREYTISGDNKAGFIVTVALE